MVRSARYFVYHSRNFLKSQPPQGIHCLYTKGYTASISCDTVHLEQTLRTRLIAENLIYPRNIATNCCCIMAVRKTRVNKPNVKNFGDMVEHSLYLTLYEFEPHRPHLLQITVAWTSKPPSYTNFSSCEIRLYCTQYQISSFQTWSLKPNSYEVLLPSHCRAEAPHSIVLGISQFQAWPSPGGFFERANSPPPGTWKVQNPNPWGRKIVLRPHSRGIYFQKSSENPQNMR